MGEKSGEGGRWRYISYRGWRLGWKEEVKVKLNTGTSSPSGIYRMAIVGIIWRARIYI